MANSGHLVRRQSSRDLNPQRSLDRLELKDIKARIMTMEKNGSLSSYNKTAYGTINDGFEDAEKPDVVSATILKSSNSASFMDTKSESKPIFHPENGEEERENWDSKLTFLLATVGYAVGLGNVWRFPYLAQKNGGGAFLIPYFVMLAIEGIPIFYLELAIGQRLRKGAIGVWNEVSPYLAGIGVSSAVVSFNVALYYNTIIAWCLFYFVQSFQAKLPWATCPEVVQPNGSHITEPECVKSTPTQYFWYRTTLMVSDDINHPLDFNWKIAIALVVAWILVYLCMIKGIASSGKVVYVTATFPYIVFVVFFFRGITLKGCSDGLRHLFTPKWNMLADPVVWLEAGTQIFFSLGLAFGGLIAFSSYNPVNNNCYRDAITVSLTNCFTSMFASIVVFSVIGFKARMAYEDCLKERDRLTIQATLEDPDMMYLNFSAVQNAGQGPVMLHRNNSHYTEIALPECSLEEELDNTASGTGLAFIIFTEAINQFPGAQFWSMLFFLMLFTLGIDSQFGTLEGVVTSIVDMKLFPNLRKELLTGILCSFCCIISMSFAHGAGNYIFTLFDNFSGNFPLLIIAFCECVAVSYIYGIKRFSDDIELMIGTRPGLYWQICWKYLSPAAMILILMASILEILVNGSGYEAWIASKGETEWREWPSWAISLIIFLISVAILWIPGLAILRAFDIGVVEEKEKSWFPADELKEYYGIGNHEVTTTESMLFCIRADGSEGICYPTDAEAQYHGVMNELEDDEL